MRPQAEVAVGCHGVLHSRAPGQPVDVTGDALDRHRHVEAGQSLELLVHDVGLQPPLGGQRRVLPVAPAAATRTAERAAGLDPVGRGLQHLDRVGPQEPRPLAAFGDAGANPLPRQGVAHEHHAAVGARDAVATVGDRADLEVEDAAHEVVAACTLAQRDPPPGPAGPRRTAPAA